MTSQEEIYKLKYLKYKQKYLELKSKVGGVGGIGARSHIKRRRNNERDEREEQRQLQIAKEMMARRLEQERFNALPEEEKAKILEERRVAEEKRIAERKEQLRIQKEKNIANAEPLIKQINDLHTNTLNAQCGFTGCRKINSNIKNIENHLNKIREFDNEIADSVIIKLNESTDKQKKCNCITFF